MIFATIGTTEPFDRLLRALDALEDEELVVQCGDSSARPTRATCLDYLPFDELVEYIRAARFVVSHAGVGTILTAVREGKRPIVVPRRAAFGEAVDDHQVALARRLDDLQLVTCVDDPRTLVDVIQTATPETRSMDHAHSDLVAELREYVQSTVQAGADASRRARSPSRRGARF